MKNRKDQVERMRRHKITQSDANGLQQKNNTGTNEIKKPNGNTFPAFKAMSCPGPSADLVAPAEPQCFQNSSICRRLKKSPLARTGTSQVSWAHIRSYMLVFPHTVVLQIGGPREPLKAAGFLWLPLFSLSGKCGELCDKINGGHALQPISRINRITLHIAGPIERTCQWQFKSSHWCKPSGGEPP